MNFEHISLTLAVIVLLTCVFIAIRSNDYMYIGLGLIAGLFLHSSSMVIYDSCFNPNEIVVGSEWMRSSHYKLISLHSKEQSSLNGSIDGKTALTFGSIHGSIQSSTDFKYSFFVEGDDGIIDHLLVNRENIQFKFGEDSLAEFYELVSVRKSGDKYYIDQNSKTNKKWVITVPEEHFPKFISIEH